MTSPSMTLHPGADYAAPPPMSVTFVESVIHDGVFLLESWWPGRLLVTGTILSLAGRRRLRYVTYDGQDLVFSLLNATATYRLLWLATEVKPGLEDVYEFDCVSCSRDID